MALPASQDDRIAALAQSDDGAAIVNQVDVAIPSAQLWSAFDRANLWPRWNNCFCWVRNRTLTQGETLIWAFEPIRPIYLYRMPAWAEIVELVPREKVTWEVKAVPGMYARHTYFMQDLGDGRTRFGSWEKAMGGGYRVIQRFWDAHFWFVNRESLAGVERLERHYREHSTLDNIGEATFS